MADPFVLTLPHPDLREAREVVVEDVEVDAVGEVALIVADAVADVVASIVEDVVADVEVLEVAVAEAQTVGALEISKARSRPSHKGHKA